MKGILKVVSQARQGDFASIIQLMLAMNVGVAVMMSWAFVAFDSSLAC